MNIFKKSMIYLILSLIFVSCEVTFNNDLRAYIDNIAERTPLGFSLSGSVVIDGKDSINLGYTVADNSNNYCNYK